MRTWSGFVYRKAGKGDKIQSCDTIKQEHLTSFYRILEVFPKDVTPKAETKDKVAISQEMKKGAVFKSERTTHGKDKW